MDINLFIGSVDGAAEYAGDKLALELKSLGHSVTVEHKPSLKNLQKSTDKLLLIITSTTGAGEIPGNFKSFWRKLYTKKISLEGITFSVAVLGDSTYGDDFCLAGKQLDVLLEEKGAKRVKSPLLVDSEETIEPEKLIVPWGIDLVSFLSCPKK